MQKRIFMKSIKKTNRKKIAIICAVIIALIAVAVGAYLILVKTPSQSKQEQVTNLQPATQSQINAGDTIKQTATENGSKPSASHTDTPTPTSGSQVDVTITAANQNGANFSVRALIGELTTSGTCTLTLTKSSTEVTKTSPIQALANSSTCQGFDIPTSQLSSGVWHLTLTVSTSDKTGSAAKDISIQ